MKYSNDLMRLRKEYQKREKEGRGATLYSFLNPAYLFMIQQRQRVMLKLLAKNYRSIKSQRVLEVGCGGGGVLQELINLGASPERITGIDLLHDRLKEGQKKLTLSGFYCADGQHLPFPRASFDIVLQFTAFSSILDDEIKKQMAGEMVRALHPEGIIIWYDFWLNPTNSQTCGIRIGEVRTLFPKCHIEAHKVTLAPPIARRIVPISWTLALILEKLWIFNTHYMILIKNIIE